MRPDRIQEYVRAADGDLPALPEGRAIQGRRQALLTRFRATGVLTLAAAALFALLPAAGASADLIETSACDNAPLTQAFAQFGDDNLYKLAPGGDMEGSLAGWTLSGGAKKVAGSEPFAATGEVGSSSVSIPAGGSVTTAPSCVNAAYPSYRFFYKSSGGLLGLVPAIKVDLVYRNGLGSLIALPLGIVLPSGKWHQSAAQLTLAPIEAALAGGESGLSIRFTAVAGTWTIDDVFVDPHCRN
jgi:hypothetical protein